MDFNIGDIVTLTDAGDQYDGNELLFAGMIGVVVDFHEGEQRYGVEWDELENGHNCGGAAQEDHGWYVPAEYLELYQDICLDLPSDEEFEKLILG